MEEKQKRDPIRHWGAVLGASVLALAIVVGVAMQVRKPRPETAMPTQAPARTQAAVRTQAALKPQAAVKPLTAAERKTSEALWVEQKKLQTDSARASTAVRDGRQQVAVTIARHFNVSQKLVNDLRNRKIDYGEITVALALSQQLMKRETLTQVKALDRVVDLRQSGQGWAAIASGLGLKLGDVIGHVEKVDRQVAALGGGGSRSRRTS